jgi:hypothetical protein
MYRNKLPHVGKHALVYRCNECLAGRIHQALQSGVGGLLVSYTRHCTKASYNVPCRPSRARSVMCANLRWRSMLGGNRVATFVWSIGSVGYRWHCRLRLHALSLPMEFNRTIRFGVFNTQGSIDYRACCKHSWPHTSLSTSATQATILWWTQRPACQGNRWCGRSGSPLQTRQAGLVSW